MKATVYCVILFCVCCTRVIADQDIHLYATGRIMEVDRCASAWLIKRYIDPQARFTFVEEGEFITRGTAFDTPDARFCRTHNLATIEVLMRHFKIDDPKLENLAAAIHDIEINYWANKSGNGLAGRLALKVKTLIRANPEPERCLNACFAYFDLLMEQLPG